MRHVLLALCLTLVVTVAGCRRGGGDSTTPEPGPTGDSASGVVEEQPAPEPPPPQPVEVRVRAIHAAATASKATVSVGREGSTVLLAEAIGFGATSAYAAASLAPDATSVTLTPTAEEFTAEAAPLPVTSDRAHTAIVYSDAENEKALRVGLFVDETAAPAEGMKARFFHAVLGWNNVDICTPGENARAAGTPVFADVAYGGLASAGYVDLPADATRIQVREANAETPCSGRVVGAVDLRPPEGMDASAKNLTLVAVGRATGRPAVQRALIACTDSPDEAPACFRLQMRPR